MTPADPIALARRIAAVLEHLDILYVIGGSVAASLYGEPRSTLDLDVMIRATEEQVTALVDALREDFFVNDEEAIGAVRHTSSFNAIEFASSMKVDFFIAENEQFARDQLARRRSVTIGAGSPLHFYAPEDLIVRKLLWYRAGGEQSERQWRDVLGILRISGQRLDMDSLRDAAKERRVEDLLGRALAGS